MHLPLVSALASFLLAAPADAPTLTILHTSDLHGHVHPHDSLADRDLGEGLARIAAAVKAIRAEGRPTLLLDSGDTIQGSPVQALVFQGRVRTGGDPIVRAMNRVGYDAMAVGNHEFDFGRERLELSRREARFPWLSANILDGEGRPAFPPYVVRTVGGVRVGLLGLITKKVPSWELPAHLGGLTFADSVDTARRYLPILRQKERCELVVVLTHQGFERDLETGQDRGDSDENQAFALAQLPGIDLLLTGHTHTNIEPRQVGQTWVSQPGRFGQTLTRFDLWLAREQGRVKVTRVVGKNLPMKDVTADPEIVQSVGAEQTQALALLAEPVAQLEAPLSVKQARTADSALLDWLQDLQRRVGGAELSFASLLPESLPDWPAGPVTLRQIWSFYPYENTLATVRATGRQVRSALEQAARCFSGLAVQDGQVVWQRNRAVLGFNCDALQGADYAIDPTRPEGERVVYLRRNGKPVRDEDTFTVALNSYRAAGGGYAVWKDCPRVFERDRSLRDLLVEEARRQETLRLEADRNWFLAPSLPESRRQP